MISRDEYAVRVMDLPEGVGGFVTESPDGFLNIYINARHSWHGQRRSFRHELRHAEEDDLHSDEPLAVIEARADGTDVRLKAIPHLMRARDLLPSLPPLGKVAPAQPVTDEVPRPSPPPPSLTPRQLAVIRRALAELDEIRLNDAYTY
jgi:hypothetical protein